MADLTAKQGNTFELLCTYFGANDTPLDVSQIDIAADIANAKGDVLCSLAVLKLASVGQFILSTTPEQTIKWPFVGNLVMDIRYAKNGVVVSTQTLSIAVEKAITLR